MLSHWGGCPSTWNRQRRKNRTWRDPCAAVLWLLQRTEVTCGHFIISICASSSRKHTATRTYKHNRKRSAFAWPPLRFSCNCSCVCLKAQWMPNKRGVSKPPHPTAHHHHSCRSAQLKTLATRPYSTAAEVQHTHISHKRIIVYMCVCVCDFIMAASLMFATAYQKLTPIVFQCFGFAAAAGASVAGKDNDGGVGEQRRWPSAEIELNVTPTALNRRIRSRSQRTHIRSVASSALTFFAVAASSSAQKTTTKLLPTTAKWLRFKLRSVGAEW